MYSVVFVYFFLFFFFKQKTAYEMRISDWSSDVCSSDLGCRSGRSWSGPAGRIRAFRDLREAMPGSVPGCHTVRYPGLTLGCRSVPWARCLACERQSRPWGAPASPCRSEEHTSELQSLMRISYAVFCLKNKKKHNSD